jgi:Cation transporter/ATPase, N-terminus
MQDGRSSRSPPQEISFSQPPHVLSAEDVATHLSVEPESGLEDAVVQERQRQYGPNAVQCPIATLVFLVLRTAD